MTTPLQRYQQELTREGFTADPAQRRAMEYFDRVYHNLSDRQQDSENWHSRITRILPFKKKPAAVRGLYLWGGVGRGKTHLMDLFCNCLRPASVLRIHFHRFMHNVHRELQRQSGHSNPLRIVAKQLSDEAGVLCLDEFHVTDIGDAMILSNLMQELINRQITLVSTSNTNPDRLYWNGLQRERFLPAIQLLKSHCEVIEIMSDTDYRLQTLAEATLYYCPADASARQRLSECFDKLEPEPSSENTAIEIAGRMLESLRISDDVVWFDFAELCEGPRSQADYLELALEFHAVLLSSVPIMGESDDSAARRFIHLVDVLYDHGVKLIVSADAKPFELYKGVQLRDSFARTASRLIEMQSHEYLAKEHH